MLVGILQGRTGHQKKSLNIPAQISLLREPQPHWIRAPPVRPQLTLISPKGSKYHKLGFCPLKPSEWGLNFNIQAKEMAQQLSVCCSSKGLVYFPEPMLGSSQLSITPDPGDTLLASVDTHKHIHIHKFKIT